MVDIQALPCTDKIPAALAPMDRMCLARYRPQHLAVTVPESLRQKSAACLFQDLALFHTAWPFNISALPDSLRGATHIWQAWDSVLEIVLLALLHMFGAVLQV